MLLLVSMLAEAYDSGPSGKGYRFRWVEEGIELAENVLIFDAGLDDRLVELVKLWTLARSGDEHLHNVLTLVGQRRRWFRRWLDFVRGEGEGSVSVGFSGYEHMLHRYGSNLVADRGWQKVDRGFALGVVERAMTSRR